MAILLSFAPSAFKGQCFILVPSTSIRRRFRPVHLDVNRELQPLGLCVTVAHSRCKHLHCLGQLQACDFLSQNKHVNPFPATHPKKEPLSPFAATHTKTASCKSFPCHTCKKQGVCPPGALASLPFFSPRCGRTISPPSYSRLACAWAAQRPRMFAYESC